MLLGTLGASLLGKILAGKRVNRAGEGIVRAGYGSSIKNKDFYYHLILTDFEIQKYYQNEPRFNGVYSRDNLPDKIKDGAYLTNLDEYSDIETHWIPLYALNDNVTYFDSFGVEHIPKEIKTFIDKSIVVTNNFRIQAYDSVKCGQFCIGFIDFMLGGKNLTNFNNLFSLNNYKKDDDIILKYFMTNVEKIIECNSHETHNIYPNLNDQQQFRLNKNNDHISKPK